MKCKLTQKARVLALLKRGWTTPLDALKHCGCLSLAQRCSEWRRDYENYWFAFQSSGPKPPEILDKWVRLPGGKRVKAYRVAK